MRKREIEKLLYSAVAEALGVEVKAPRQKFASKVARLATLGRARTEQHRVAA